MINMNEIITKADKKIEVPLDSKLSRLYHFIRETTKRVTFKTENKDIEEISKNIKKELDKKTNLVMIAVQENNLSVAINRANEIAKEGNYRIEHFVVVGDSRESRAVVVLFNKY